jgi:spore coat assembly protein
LIHALDPLYIAAKVSFTSIKDTVQMKDVIQHTMSGLEGLGGMETRGSHRMGLPGLNFIFR